MKHSRSQRVIQLLVAGVAVTVVGAVLVHNLPQSWQPVGRGIHSLGMLIMLGALTLILTRSVVARREPSRVVFWLAKKLREWRPQQRILVLNGWKLSDIDIRRIAAMQSLTILSLEDTNIRDGEIKFLARLPQLAHLNLRGTAVSDFGLRYLALMPNLRRVLLARTSVTDAGLERLTQAMPNCEVDVSDEYY